MSRKNISLSILFTARQLIKWSMHVGVNHMNVNRSNSYYILGVYKSVSIINLSRIMPMLKKKFFFFFKFMKKSYSNVLLANSLPMKFSLPMRKIFEVLSVYYFFGRWWNGFIKNYKIFSKSKNSLENNIYVPKLPHFGFYVPLNDNYNDVSGYAFSAEFESVGIHSLVFFDSHKSIKLIKTGVMLNTKTLLNNYFLSYLIFSVLFKINFIKRKEFYWKVINNVDIDFYEDDSYEINRKRALFKIRNFFEKFFKLENKIIFFRYKWFAQEKNFRKKFIYSNKRFFITWKDFLK